SRAHVHRARNRPTGSGPRTSRSPVAEQIALLMDQERELRVNIESSVRHHFAPLLDVAGVQPIVAAGLIAELGMPRPGFGVAQIAVLAGVAPIEASSAGEVRHRLSRRGNRRLNMLLYLITLAQQRATLRLRPTWLVDSGK